MKRIVGIVYCLLLTTFVFAQQPIKDVNVQVREAKGFHAIHVSSAFKVFLSEGKEEKVAVSAADQKDLANIVVKVKNGVLYVGWDRKIWWGSGNKRLKAYISFTKLDAFTASGASDIDIEGKVVADGDFNLELSGASDLTGKIEVGESLNVNLSGASDAALTGGAKKTKIEAHGASSFKGYDFSVDICDVTATGASDVKITVNKELTADASGASAVKYKGDAKERDVRKSGASSVSRS